MSRGRKLTRVIEFEERTITEVAEEFYTHKSVKGLAEATLKQYKMYIGNFIKWYGEDKQIIDLTSAILDKYVEMFLEKGIKKVSVATTMRHIGVFVKFAIKRGYMMEAEVTIPKYEEEQKEPYTEEEMELLLAKPKRNDNWVEYRNWAMVNYFYGTGQRLSTVLNIKVEHLNFDKGEVFLNHNKDKIKKHTPLSSATIKILKEYIELSGLQEQDYLFPEYEGGQLKTRSCQDAIADYNKSRGVSKTSIHLFRHTFAKTYIMNGGNPAKLQQLLHHKTIEMSMHYVNLCSNDIGKDLDLFSPLDNFKRSNYTPTNRRGMRVS